MQEFNEVWVVTVNGVPQLWLGNQADAISRAKSWLRASIDVQRQGLGDCLLSVPAVRVTLVSRGNK